MALKFTEVIDSLSKNQGGFLLLKSMRWESFLYQYVGIIRLLNMDQTQLTLYWLMPNDLKSYRRQRFHIMSIYSLTNARTRHQIKVIANTAQRDNNVYLPLYWYFQQ